MTEALSSNLDQWRKLHFKKYRAIFHVNNAKYLVKWMEKSVQDISKGKILDSNYIIDCLNYLISIEKKTFALWCRAIMLYKMTNNNSISTWLILLTPTVYTKTSKQQEGCSCKNSHPKCFKMASYSCWKTEAQTVLFLLYFHLIF